MKADTTPTSLECLGWHSRGYHPHCDVPQVIQHIIFRLYDSVPRELIERWKVELHIASTANPESPAILELLQRIEFFEDAGHGACYLRDPYVANIVQNALLHFDDTRYRLLEWCVMPNHVHCLIETIDSYSLGRIVKSWKAFTARQANKHLKRSGDFWMPDYYDRLIRSYNHISHVRFYIRNNPVAAGLCTASNNWAYSSAGADKGKPATIMLSER